MSSPCLSCGWRALNGCTNSKEKWEECIYGSEPFENHVPRKGPSVPCGVGVFTFKMDNLATMAELKLEGE